MLFITVIIMAFCGWPHLAAHHTGQAMGVEVSSTRAQQCGWVTNNSLLQNFSFFFHFFLQQQKVAKKASSWQKRTTKVAKLQHRRQRHKLKRHSFTSSCSITWSAVGRWFVGWLDAWLSSWYVCLLVLLFELIEIGCFYVQVNFQSDEVVSHSLRQERMQCHNEMRQQCCCNWLNFTTLCAKTLKFSRLLNRIIKFVPSN